MLKDVFTNLIGNAIVASGRAIKINDLDIFAKYNFEITPEQYVVLNMIKEDDTPSQNRLCKLLFKDKSNMTRIISVLEEKGLIKKEQTDRSNVIMITEKGKKLKAEITPVINEVRKKYLKNISQDDMYTCIKVLEQIQKNLETI